MSWVLQGEHLFFVLYIYVSKPSVKSLVLLIQLVFFMSSSSIFCFIKNMEEENIEKAR